MNYAPHTLPPKAPICFFSFFLFFGTDLPPAGKFAGLRSFQRLIQWETCLIGVIHQIDCFITHFIIYSCTRGWCSHLLHIQVGGFIPIGGFSLLQHPLFVRTAAETKAGNLQQIEHKRSFLHCRIACVHQMTPSVCSVLCICLVHIFARNKHGAFETKCWIKLKIRPSETSFSTQRTKRTQEAQVAVKRWPSLRVTGAPKNTEHRGSPLPVNQMETILNIVSI